MGKYSTEFKITLKIYFSKIACNKKFLKVLLKLGWNRMVNMRAFLSLLVPIISF